MLDCCKTCDKFNDLVKSLTCEFIFQPKYTYFHHFDRSKDFSCEDFLSLHLELVTNYKVFPYLIHYDFDKNQFVVIGQCDDGEFRSVGYFIIEERKK